MVLARVPAPFFPLFLAGSAASVLATTLLLACRLHYLSVVKNEFYGYPDEWVPTISATIGDHKPERNVFMIGMALCAGPKFVTLFLHYAAFAKTACASSKRLKGLNLANLAVAFARTWAAGFWIYVTSSDFHSFHISAFVGYLLTSMLNMIFTTILAFKSRQRDRKSPYAKTIFLLGHQLAWWTALYFYLEHKDEEPGAYSYYAMCEWTVGICDVLFEASGWLDFRDLEIHLVAMGGQEPVDALQGRKED
eukprot:tig00020912_g15799.t1